MSIPDTGMLESIQASARDRVASPSPNVPDRYPTMFKPGVNGVVACAGDLFELAIVLFVGLELVVMAVVLGFIDLPEIPGSR